MSTYQHLKQEHNEQYYNQASEWSENIFENPGFVRVFGITQKAKSICEVGCGNGVKLSQLARAHQKATGIDINAYAIEQARKHYPEFEFVVTDGAQAPVAESSFDVVTSFFALEHVDSPQDFMEELVRLTKPGGHTAVICPNFGSPLFVAPPVKYGKSALGKIVLYFKRIVQNIVFHTRGITDPESLRFMSVTPILDKYESDFDTVNEPYLYTLEAYCKAKGYEIEHASSLWETRPLTKLGNLPYAVFKWLAPFTITRYWGPQICLIIKRPQS